MRERRASHEKESRLSCERLRVVLRYDPETGQFWWRSSGPGRPLDVPAGGPSNNGHWRIAVDGARYEAHRLAWLYMTGEWPKDQVDHKNRIGVDNRWHNLREATHLQNQGNRGCNKNSATGVVGVHRDERDGLKKRYRAQLMHDGRRIWLGRFETLEEASAAYQAATLIRGEFSPYYREGANG